MNAMHPTGVPAVARRARFAWLSRRLLGAGFAAALLAAGLSGRVTAQTAGTPNEYTVKAAFLFNFAKFVEWPAEAFASPASPVVIAVLGRDPFGPMLDEMTHDERVNGREIVVRRVKWDDNLGGAHILFVGSSEARRMPQLLDRLGGTSVLTVGEYDEFARGGGMIHFVTQNYRVRFEINARAASNAGLKISSKLLSLATIVEPRRTAEAVR